MSVELDDIQVKKSNPLIQSMGTPSVLANQLLLTALVHADIADPAHPSPVISKEDWKRIKETTNADYTKGLVAIFPQSEIRRATGRSNSGSYYQGLKTALNSSPKSKTEGAQALANQWEIIINSRGVHEHVSLITASAYDTVTKTVFIKFSDEEKVQKHIYNLQRNYTTFSYQQLMRFKNQYSSKLYELLKSRIDYDDSKSGVIQNTYTFTYNLSHLKFMLGVLNPFNSNETIRLLGLSNPDYDAIADMIYDGQSDTKGYEWYDFKRFVLSKCQREINKLTEFDIEYKEGVKGRAGKVLEVVFTVTRKTDVIGTPTQKTTKSKTKPVPVCDEDELLEMIVQIKTLLGSDCTAKDARSIAEAAEYDMSRVKTAYDLMMASGTEVSNVTGWMITAIKESYKTSSVTKPAKMKKNRFNSFEQNEYDFDALEEALLDN